MIAALLLKAVVEFLRTQLSEYAAAQDDKGNYVPPNVFEWSLPFRSGKMPQADQSDFPYVVVRPKGGLDEEDGSTLAVDILFGVYRESAQMSDGKFNPDGYNDLLALIEHVRGLLQVKRVIDDRYELLKPFKWEIPHEQPYPYWEGWAETKWQVAAVLPQEDEVDLHGSRW